MVACPRPPWPEVIREIACREAADGRHPSGVAPIAACQKPLDPRGRIRHHEATHVATTRPPISGTACLARLRGQDLSNAAGGIRACSGGIRAC